MRRAKIYLMGSSCSGKSTLAYQLTIGKFVTMYQETIENIFACQSVIIERDKKSYSSHVVNYDLYDIAGDVFASSDAVIAREYYRVADAVVVVYNPYDETSVNTAVRIVRSLRSIHGNEFPIVLIENVRIDSSSYDKCFRSLRYLVVHEDDGRAQLYSINLKHASSETVNAIMERLLKTLIEQRGKTTTSRIRAYVPLVDRLRCAIV